MRAAIVFAAAPLAPTARLRARLADINDEQPFVVAADQGAATALAFGWRPDVVIGDLDSLDASTLVDLRRQGVPIETHPRDKDATDGELAVQRALQSRPRCLLLLGFLGGPRLDQTVANLLLLTRLDTPAVLLDEHNECSLLRGPGECAWRPEHGEVVSLVPLDGHVAGVRTRALRWPLEGERLEVGRTRGVSNEPISEAEEVRVSIEHGLLLVTRHFPEQ